MVQGEDCVLRESGDCFHWLIIKIIFKIAPRIVAWKDIRTDENFGELSALFDGFY